MGMPNLATINELPADSGIPNPRHSCGYRVRPEGRPMSAPEKIQGMLGRARTIFGAWRERMRNSHTIGPDAIRPTQLQRLRREAARVARQIRALPPASPPQQPAMDTESVRRLAAQNVA